MDQSSDYIDIIVSGNKIKNISIIDKINNFFYDEHTCLKRYMDQLLALNHFYIVDDHFFKIVIRISLWDVISKLTHKEMRKILKGVQLESTIIIALLTHAFQNYSFDDYEIKIDTRNKKYSYIILSKDKKQFKSIKCILHSKHFPYS